MNGLLSDSDAANLQLEREAEQVHTEPESLEPASHISNSTEGVSNPRKIGEENTKDIVQDVNRIAFGTINKPSRSPPAQKSKRTHQEIDNSEDEGAASNKKRPRPTVESSNTGKKVGQSPKELARVGALARPDLKLTSIQRKETPGKDFWDIPSYSPNRSSSQAAPNEEAYRREKPNETYGNTSPYASREAIAPPDLVAKRGRGRPKGQYLQAEKKPLKSTRASSNAALSLNVEKEHVSDQSLSKGYEAQEGLENITTKPPNTKTDAKANKDVRDESRPEEDSVQDNIVETEENSSDSDGTPEPNAILSRHIVHSPRRSPALGAPSRPVIELLGQDNEWKEIISAARSVGTSKIQGVLKTEVPKMKTSTIKDMIQSINESRKMYGIVASVDIGEGHSASVQNLDNIDVGPIDRRLMEKVESLSESALNEKGQRKVIQDVYAHAIPQLVELLDVAFRCRSAELSNRTDCDTLGEVIFLQDILLLLCQKAAHWKAEPTTKRPIKKNTRQVIFPQVRKLRSVFQRELEERQQRLRQKQNVARLRASQAERDQSFEREQEAIEQKKAAILRRIEQEVTLRTTKLYKALRIKAPHDSQIQGNKDRRQRQPSKDEWSDEQDLALLTRLFSEDVRNLPAAEIHLDMLNDPLLQNKLPEHIRQRILHFRPAMQARLGDTELAGWISSIT